MPPLQLGILGFGRIGAEHAGWIATADGISVAAVADATEARRALAAQRGLRAVSNFDALLHEPAIEAVLIATPTSMHFDQARQALAAGKHVMVEKPITLDAAQARELLRSARTQNRVLSVFHNRRWDLDYLTVRQAVGSGIFGKIINVESRLGQWGSCVGPAAREYRPQWRTEKSFGGGGLYDWGSHFVDQIWRLLWPARPSRVFAQLRNNVWSSDCDDLARICIDFDNGAVALVEINTTTTRPLPRWHIDGSLGSADSPASAAFDLATWAQLSFTAAHSTSAQLLEPAKDVLSEREIWEHFARAVRSGEPPAVSAESVLPTMVLLDAARNSSQRQSAVAITCDEWVY